MARRPGHRMGRVGGRPQPIAKAVSVANSAGWTEVPSCPQSSPTTPPGPGRRRTAGRGTSRRGRRGTGRAWRPPRAGASPRIARRRPPLGRHPDRERHLPTFRPRPLVPAVGSRHPLPTPEAAKGFDGGRRCIQNHFCKSLVSHARSCTLSKRQAWCGRNQYRPPATRPWLVHRLRRRGCEGRIGGTIPTTANGPAGSQELVRHLIHKPSRSMAWSRGLGRLGASALPPPAHAPSPPRPPATASTTPSPGPSAPHALSARDAVSRPFDTGGTRGARPRTRPG